MSHTTKQKIMAAVFGALFFSALGAGTTGLFNWAGAEILSDTGHNYDTDSAAIAGVIGGSIFGGVEGLITGPVLLHLSHENDNEHEVNKYCLFTTFSGLCGLDILAGLTGQAVLSKLNDRNLGGGKQAASAAVGISIELISITGFLTLAAACFYCYVTCSTGDDKAKGRIQQQHRTAPDYGAL